jgi:hypothetical protein
VDVTFSLSGGKSTSIGSVIIPIILTNADTNTRFRIKLHALVLPKLLVDMFISQPKWIRSEAWGGGKIVRSCEFRDGEVVRIVSESGL